MCALSKRVNVYICLQFVYVLKFLVAINIIENSHVDGNYGANNTRQCNGSKFIHKLYTNEYDRSCVPKKIRKIKKKNCKKNDTNT